MKIGYFFSYFHPRLFVVPMIGDGHTILAKIALTIIVAACLVSVGYSGGTDTPPDEAGQVAEPLAGTAWHLVAFRADNGSVAAPLPGAQPLIIFGDSGTLSGSAGCNLYAASYRINGSGIKVEPVAVTAAYPAKAQELMQQESRYRELLVAASSYRIEDGQLVLSGPSGRDLLVFDREELPESVPLLGTEWQLARYSSVGSTVVSPVPGTTINLTFDPDGTLSGSAGCNAYSAPYRVNETGIAVERIIATKASATGPEGIMEQEAAYLALLRTAAGYRIVGDTLAVIDGNGRAILFFKVEGLASTPL